MFDGVTDDDESFFTPVSSSNLASLFGISNSNAQSNISSINTSLTYNAPKQPTNKSEDSLRNVSTVKHQSSVIEFKEVYVLRMVDKKYVNQGKCGLALIGNDDVNLYQLLLYKQKNDIISSTKVVNNFEFILKKDNHASFYDDRKQYWTVHFNTEVDLNEFSSKLKSRGTKLVEEIETNIEPVSTINVKNVDKEEIKPVDSDESDIKANILSRMAKMGQKLLPNTSISDGTDSDTEKDKPLRNQNKKTKRGTVATKSLSLNSTDIANTSVPSTKMQDITSYLQPVMQQQYAIANGHQTVVSSPVMFTSTSTLMPPPPPPSYEQFQMYFTENRTHNSEVRMNILRLTNKMEQVLEKVDKIESNRDKTDEDALKEENTHLKRTIKILEEKISRENEEFIKQVEQYKQRIKELELKIKEYEDMNNEAGGGDKINDKRKDEVTKSIKRFMNNLYSEVTDEIQDENMQIKDLKRVFAEKIRENTYNIISAVTDL